MWINGPSMRSAEEKGGGISPKSNTSIYKMIPHESPSRVSNQRNKYDSTFYESDCKDVRISNKENKFCESKKYFRRTHMTEESKIKHLSIGSTYSNSSNYSDDFEEYVENGEDCIDGRAYRSRK